MGLAASQARFLGITLRKANCEFKSTELAQQRLQLTNQLADISQEYADALNATKFVWHNDLVCDSFGNPMDFGISYSLLMMPSAANDFDPYMVTSKSGAVVLNSKYADAAEYAGISMAGGVPSAEGRNKFLKALANIDNAKPDNPRVVDNKDNNVITETTYNILTGASSEDVAWNPSAGMGAAPKNKSVGGGVSIIDLMMDENIGQKSLDWLQIYKAYQGSSYADAVTEYQYNEEKARLSNNLADAKLRYINEGQASAQEANSVAVDQALYQSFEALEKKIDGASNDVYKKKYISELENLKRGLDADGKLIDNDEKNAYKYPIYWAAYELQKLEASKNEGTIQWISGKDETGNYLPNDATHANIDLLFQTSDSAISGGICLEKKSKDANGNDISETYNTLTLVYNDIIKFDPGVIQNLTIADLLKNDIVLMARGKDDAKTLSTAAQAMLEYVARVLGYGSIGKGLNIDETANNAMELAMKTTIKKVLNPSNAVKSGGSGSDDVRNNDAYKNAINYNRIGETYDGGFAAINLSSVISSFLTYFDNYLNGSESGYIVGRANDSEGEGTRTYFVTDDPNYVYLLNPENALSNDEKIADFYNELYNNICAHGWRHDEMVNDSEYLESAIKDGRYQLMALNNDGYFYQMRYNDLPYLVEEQDEDAITRAEAAFTTKKAQITFKEDEIDIKTKKLDAEISELNTEINSVQNIITKSIEKTFSMFSN